MQTTRMLLPALWLGLSGTAWGQQARVEARPEARAVQVDHLAVRTISPKLYTFTGAFEAFLPHEVAGEEDCNPGRVVNADETMARGLEMLASAVETFDCITWYADREISYDTARLEYDGVSYAQPYTSLLRCRLDPADRMAELTQSRVSAHTERGYDLFWSNVSQPGQEFGFSVFGGNTGTLGLPLIQRALPPFDVPVRQIQR